MTNTAPCSKGQIFAVSREPERSGVVKMAVRSALAPAFSILSALAAPSAALYALADAVMDGRAL